MSETDEERGWIQKSQQGDHEAFAQLVRRHQKMISALTFRMTGSLADSEDLAQEAFISAYRNLHAYRSAARFSSWLYRIAINQCLNWIHRQKNQNDLKARWGAECQVSAASLNDPHLRAVQEALLKLPPKYRAAIILTVYDGMSHGEAARALGCAEATVSWRVFTARRSLKKILRDFDPASTQ